MSVMVKLQLAEGSTLQDVESLPAFKDVKLDKSYGIVCINPPKGLFIVRADSLGDIESKQKLSPEIVGVYGDVRISSTKPATGEKDDEG